MKNKNEILMPANRFGYQVNINHPKIKPVYEAYKKKHNIMIMSDDERLEFEEKLIDWLMKKKNEK